MTELKLDIHRDIIERCRKGERKAQYQLYQLYAKAMLNTCYRMLNSQAEAEDMLQEVFVEMFRKLDSFRYESTFGAWLKRITVNRCINEMNRKVPQLEYFDESMEKEEELDLEENVEQLKITVEQIRNAVEKLPKGNRMIFNLYMMEGYDHEEIAQILNVSVSTSKTQYMKARKKIKELLN